MPIRSRRDSDVERCVQLLIVTHYSDRYPRYLPSDPRAFLLSDSELAAWVATANDGVDIVGHVSLHDAAADPLGPAAAAACSVPVDQLVVLARLLVAPSARRLGVGRALMATALAEAHRQGLRTVLDVVKDSIGAIAAYERTGWTRVGEMLLDVEGGPALNLWIFQAPPVLSGR